jgi:two-component system, cell cycle sensor histidine kinase and response regulator CckA
VGFGVAGKHSLACLQLEGYVNKMTNCSVLSRVPYKGRKPRCVNQERFLPPTTVAPTRSAMKSPMHRPPALSLLIVEDDRSAAQSLGETLALKYPGCTVHLAGDGKTGVELFKKQAPDIVITDMAMPELNGIEMAAQIRALDPHATIIAVTAMSDTRHLLDAIRVGINRYVLKPIVLETLFEAMDDCISRITSQRLIQAQNELISKLSSAVDQSTNMVVITDSGGAIEYVNPKFTEVTGYSGEEVAGRSLKMLMADTASSEVFEQLRSTVTSGCEWRGEIVCSKKDRTLFCAEVHVTPLATGEGNEAHFVAVVQDISERKRAEKALQESDERWKFAIEGSGDGVWDWDIDTDRVKYSRRWKEMLGYSEDDILPTNQEWVDRIHPEDQVQVAAAMQDYLAGKTAIYVVEYRLRCKDGSYKWILGRGMVVSRAEDGRALRMIGTHTDITVRKQIEEKFRLSEEKFSTAFRVSPDAINITRLSDGMYLEINEGFTTLTGYTTDDVLGKSALDLNIWDDPEDRGRLVRELKASGVVNNLEAKFRRKDGSKLTGLMSARNIQVEGVPCLISITRDISERKRAEEEHRRMEEQMLHAQKLESLGVLAGGIAHDFNNILMSIIGNADLALMRINKESPAVENLRQIELASARAADLAKQMLAYSGKGRFVVENHDLNGLLEEMLHMLEVSISKKAVLRLNLSQPLPTVEVDATQVRQIVMNLVINASEAIGERSGVIAITTGCMDCDKNYLKNVWLSENIGEGLYVYLEVADTGSGMTKETLARLFDPFFTTKFSGRGLGMAAVLGIVKGHKGAIRVYSEPGKGSTFKILLPASSRPADLFNHDIDPQHWQGSGSVLLVDDEETVRGIGSEMLRELGFTPITADDGREGIRIFKETPGIAFVILDLTMPHMDGEQCFRELRRLDPGVKVIMTSGYNEHEVTQKFVGKGLAGFLQKPYKFSDLKKLIISLESL